MPQTATSPSPSPSSPLNTLSAALASETKLIDDLTSVVLRQRAAIANDDIQAVDDTVFMTHRLLLTLEEARTRRRSLYRLLDCDEDMTLGALEDTLGPRATSELGAGRTALQHAAERLSHEISVNREILQETLAHGDACIRALNGVSHSRAPIYGIEGMSHAYAETSFSRTV